MTRYESGRRFEWRVRRHLEERGWFVVRSAGSRGLVDLMAVGIDPHTRERKVLFIQCKADGRMDRSSRERLVKAAEVYYAIPVVARRVGRRMVLENVELKNKEAEK